MPGIYKALIIFTVIIFPFPFPRTPLRKKKKIAGIFHTITTYQPT